MPVPDDVATMVDLADIICNDEGMCCAASDTSSESTRSLSDTPSTMGHLQPGTQVVYLAKDGASKLAVIRDVHHDDMQVYVTICVGGKERQTESGRVRLVSHQDLRHAAATRMTAACRGFMARRAIEWLVPIRMETHRRSPSASSKSDEDMAERMSPESPEHIALMHAQKVRSCLHHTRTHSPHPTPAGEQLVPQESHTSAHHVLRSCLCSSRDAAQVFDVLAAVHAEEKTKRTGRRRTLADDLRLIREQWALATGARVTSIARKDRERLDALQTKARTMLGDAVATSILSPSAEALEPIKHLLHLSADEHVALGSKADLEVTLVEESERVDLVVRPTATAAELLAAYAQRVGADVRTLRLLHDGERVAAGSLLGTLDLQHGALTVSRECHGGATDIMRMKDALVAHAGNQSSASMRGGHEVWTWQDYLALVAALWAAWGNRIANAGKAMEVATGHSANSCKIQLSKLRKSLEASAPALAADLLPLPTDAVKGDARWRALASAASQLLDDTHAALPPKPLHAQIADIAATPSARAALGCAPLYATHATDDERGSVEGARPPNSKLQTCS